jgi:hypothetical protein
LDELGRVEPSLAEVVDLPQQAPASFPMGTKNVLIIDGNEAMQTLRARVLRSRSSCAHGQQRHGSSVALGA